MGKHFLLYGHGGAYNHGAEAIVKTTISLLREVSPGCHITLSTHFKEQDVEFGVQADEFCERDPYYLDMDKRSELKGLYDCQIYKQAINSITGDTICLSVGGDTYCYGNWNRQAVIHKAALERGAKSILWSCSIDPEVIDSEMLEVLKSHNLITARESVTFDELTKRSLSNAMKVSDIAFKLDREPVDFPLEDYIALNVSPLIIRRNPIVLPAFQTLLDYILTETNMNIALVPHVVQTVDNDYDALRLLNVGGSNRVLIASDKLSAAQYKSIISNANFCIAARTHVAIAAYSSLVPTLAIGYSSKAQGIASDLGMSEYVLGVDQINNERDVIDKFLILKGSKEHVKSELSSRIPDYIQAAVSESFSCIF